MWSCMRAGSWTLSSCAKGRERQNQGPVWGKLPQNTNICDLGVLETKVGFLCSAALDAINYPVTKVLCRQRSNPAHVTDCRFLWVWLHAQVDLKDKTIDRPSKVIVLQVFMRKGA